MNLWMNKCQTSFAFPYKYVCQMCFQCIKCTNYEWTKLSQLLLLRHEMISLWCNTFNKYIIELIKLPHMSMVHNHMKSPWSCHIAKSN
jgi:hypothetical protein